MHRVHPTSMGIFSGHHSLKRIARSVIKRWLWDFEELAARVKIRELLFYAIAWNCVTDAGKAALTARWNSFVHTWRTFSNLFRLWTFLPALWNSRRVNSSFEENILFARLRKQCVASTRTWGQSIICRIGHGRNSTK